MLDFTVIAVKPIKLADTVALTNAAFHLSVGEVVALSPVLSSQEKDIASADTIRLHSMNVSSGCVCKRVDEGWEVTRTYDCNNLSQDDEMYAGLWDTANTEVY